jgi:hypothetical protein
VNGQIAIQGGFVYRGNAIPALAGKFVFGDLGSTNAKLFYMDAAGGTISALQFTGDSAPLSAPLDSMGEDQNGAIYALLANGNVIQLVPEPGTCGLLVVLVSLSFRRLRQKQIISPSPAQTRAIRPSVHWSFSRP